MQLIIHRGTHEIGGNCVEVDSGKTRVIIDLGIPLVDPKDKKPGQVTVTRQGTVMALRL